MILKGHTIRMTEEELRVQQEVIRLHNREMRRLRRARREAEEVHQKHEDARARVLLKELLASRFRAAEDVLNIAIGRGIPPDSVRRARHQLGVRVSRGPRGRWTHWRLPRQ